MTLRLRNTLSRRIEPVRPSRPDGAGMYTCGPTVYRHAHLGNLRSYLLADMIRRALLYHGIAVFHVKNITDVGHLRDERFDRGEDRMLVAAGLESRSPAEIADAYEAAFHEDEAAVNILAAHVFPRATEHVPDMIELAERLVDLGHAYVTDEGNVYFAVSTWPGYGRLSGNSPDDLRAGHRGPIEPDKRDPVDFALWKAAGEGRLLRWPSPRWGEGSPGWHLECSAMALHYLGSRFDLHTGGIDNVFPHHEDEIAQSAPLTGDVPARHWVHGEHLLMGGHKMAKSAGNFERIADISSAGIDPLAFRYLTLTARYGHKLHYSTDSLDAAAAGLASLRARLRALGPPPGSGPWSAPPVIDARPSPARPEGVERRAGGHGSSDEPDSKSVRLPDRAHAPMPPLSTNGRALHERFVEAIDDDLDLPAALAVTREIVRSDLGADERRWLVLDADAILGLDLHRVWTRADTASGRPLPDDVMALVDERRAARSAGEFDRADELRRQLAERGFDVVDAPDGATDVRPAGRAG